MVEDEVPEEAIVGITEGDGVTDAAGTKTTGTKGAGITMGTKGLTGTTGLT